MMRSTEDLERELRKKEAAIERYREESKGYSDILRSLGTKRKGVPPYRFLGEERVKPHTIWGRFVDEMEEAADTEEAKEIFDKYVRQLVYGRGGFTKETASKKLLERLRKSQEEEEF